MRRIILVVMCLSGCVTERRQCLDWAYYKTIKDDCTPLYGEMICIEKEVTHYYCVRYGDDNVANTNNSVGRSGRGTF